MNDKPFTLYYINSLKYIKTNSFQASVGKIADVRTVSKGLTILGFKENSNHYAIVGDRPNIISMGMVVKIETKNKNIIYLGQKIYSNSQKELFDYIKREVTTMLQKLENDIVRAQDMKRNLSATPFSVERRTTLYDEFINQSYKQIKTIKANSKELITNLKKA